MGRSSYSQRLEANYLIKITIYQLNRPHLLRGYRSYSYWRTLDLNNNLTGEKIKIDIWLCTMVNNEFTLFDYAITNEDDETKSFSHKFPLVKTSCNFGGERYWFLCSIVRNGESCGKRIGALYLKDNYFACRHCHDLTYSSRKLSGLYKSIGDIIPAQDVDDARDAVKRTHYAGKPTKKYKRYLIKEQKFKRILYGHLMGVNEMMVRRNERKMRGLDEETKKKLRKGLNLL